MATSRAQPKKQASPPRPRAAKLVPSEAPDVARTPPAATARRPGVPAGYLSRVTDWLWVGGAIRDEAMMADLVQRLGITHILSVAEELNDEQLAAPYTVQTLQIPWLDDSHHPAPKPVLDFLAGLGWLANEDRDTSNAGHPVVLYVHCFSGKHRGPLMATFLLAALTGYSANDAAARVKAAHPRGNVWAAKPWRKSVKRSLRVARKLLAKYEPQGAILQRTADLRLINEEALAWLDDYEPEQDDPPVEEPLPAFQFTSADQAALVDNAYAAMRAAFLARWRELGHLSQPAPSAALARLRAEARGGISQLVRSHNRGAAALVSTTATKWATTQPAASEAARRNALYDALDDWRQRKAADALRVSSGHLSAVAGQLADLYAAGRDARFTLDDLSTGASGASGAGDDPATAGATPRRGCPSCAPYVGRRLDRQSAWQFLSQFHLGCQHRLRLVASSL